MQTKNITGMEQMEQDKEAGMITAVRDCISLLSQVMTLLILPFTLFRSVKCRARFKSQAQNPQLPTDADLLP